MTRDPRAMDEWKELVMMIAGFERLLGVEGVKMKETVA